MANLGTEESGRCKEVAVAERLKQELVYGFFVRRDEKSGRCRVMAVSEGSTVSIGKRLLEISTFYGINSVCRSHVLQKILIKCLTLISTHS